MKALAIILIIIYVVSRKPKKRKAQIILYDPVKIQRLNAAQAREADRIRRENERREDRQRRIALQASKETERREKEARKQAEKEAQAQEARQAAQNKIDWISSMLERYSALYDEIENELADHPYMESKKRIQLKKQQLAFEEKIRRFSEQRDKAYYTMTH